MKKLILSSLTFAGLVLLFSGICISGFSQGTGAVKLVYNYPADKQITYLTKSTMAQIMDFQGQTMQVDVKSAFGCSVKTAGKQENNLKVEVRVDTLGQTTDSPMGGTGGAVQDVVGKTCNMIISPEGKVVDMSETAKIVYTNEGGSESNLTQALNDFFPVLPQKPVKAGETWESNDSSIVTSPSLKMKTFDNSVNKLEAIEIIDGIQCARVSTNHTGTMIMTVNNQGMDIFIKGPFTGTSEYLFAIKEGYFIKLTSAIKMTGNMEISSPETMTVPITLDMKSVNEMKK
ncbi:MAG: hypothetical protein Q8868_02210 [Bacteroidota bacterium]|nr:hypothetical protein [Bacteroidota bacterium]